MIKMIDYDLHIHTAYCGHAPEMTVEAICRQADVQGLRLIIVTDHIFEPSDLNVIEQIRREVDALRPQCRVLVGAEVDVDWNSVDGKLVTDQLEGLDYVIAGFHYVPTMGHYPWSIDQRKMEIETFLELWERSLLGIVTNPHITTLAHPGRMLAACADLDVYFEYGLTVLEKVAKRSAENNIAWELNELTGHRLPAGWQSQWHRLYEVALSAGVKVVFGSDAHTLDSIGHQTFAGKVLANLPPGSLAQPEDILV